MTQESECNKERFHREERHDVLANDCKGPSGVANEPEKFQEVIRHESDVGRLDCRVTSDRSYRDEARPMAVASLIPSPTIPTVL